MVLFGSCLATIEVFHLPNSFLLLFGCVTVCVFSWVLFVRAGTRAVGLLVMAAMCMMGCVLYGMHLQDAMPVYTWDKSGNGRGLALAYTGWAASKFVFAICFVVIALQLRGYARRMHPDQEV